MKTNPIVLILTLLFCLSGSVFAELDLKEDFNKERGKKDFDKYFNDKKCFVYKQIDPSNYNRQTGNRDLKLRYDGAFTL